MEVIIMASNKCFMRIEKIKTYGALTARYNHDYRIADVDNADPERKGKNEILFALPKDADGNTMGYYEAWQKRVTEAQEASGWDHVRSNAILAYDIVLSYSADFQVDLDEWKKRNVHWLQTTFNRGHGQNLLSCVMHRDEGNIHCHAIVVPITPDGRLSASYYTDGAVKMSRLQDSYAKEMETLGLKRGQRGSSAKHKDIRHVYADLKQDIRIPKPRRGELAKDYLERAENAMMDRQGTVMRKAREEERQRRAKLDSELALEREEARKEQAAMIATARLERDRIAAEYHKIFEKKNALEKEAAETRNTLGQLQASIQDALEKLSRDEQMLEDAQKYRSIQDGLSRLQESDPEKAAEAQEALELCLDAGDAYRGRTELELRNPEIFGPA